MLHMTIITRYSFPPFYWPGLNFGLRTFTDYCWLSQEVLRWIQEVVDDIGSEVSLDQLKDYIHKTLKSGRVLVLSNIMHAFCFMRRIDLEASVFILLPGQTNCTVVDSVGRE